MRIEICYHIGKGTRYSLVRREQCDSEEFNVEYVKARLSQYLKLVNQQTANRIGAETCEISLRFK